MGVAKDLKKMRQHEVVQCEMLGDTLIVMPQGEIQAFATSDFQEEVQRIKRVASDESVSNIICDFGAKSYFSQGVVVPLLGLRDQIRTRGRFVVCGVSEEMGTLFEHSESGTHLLQYQTRNDAVADVATVSWSATFRSALKRNRNGFLALGVIGLVVAALVAWNTFGERLLKGSRARQLYHDLEVVWDDARTTVNSNPTKANWNGLGNRFLEAVHDGVVEIRDLEQATPAELAVAAAANQLQMMSQVPQTSVKRMQERFLELTDAARLEIQQEDDITVDKIEPIEFKEE